MLAQLLLTLASLALAPLARASVSPAWESAVAAAPAACSAECKAPAIECSVSNCPENAAGMQAMCGTDGLNAVEACAICLWNEASLPDEVELSVQDAILSSCLGPSYTTLDWSTSVLNAGGIITNAPSSTKPSSAKTTSVNYDTMSAGDGEGDYYNRSSSATPTSPASSPASTASSAPTPTAAPGGGAGALGVSWVLAVAGLAAALF